MTESKNPISTVLEKYERFGIDLSLERIQIVLERLGNPQNSVPIIHVTGTNGKGSVCAYLSAVLGAAGYRVGRYTSPHLVDWSERICLNNQPIDSERLLFVLNEVEQACQNVALTQFEVITAAAWVLFAQSVDVAVIEVGLGGRLDATNVCDRPLVSIITSISLEHWQRLGSTLAKIAYEKAGIIKGGCPVLVGQLPMEAMTVIQDRAKELQSPLTQPAIAQWTDSPDSESKYPWAIAQNISYPVPLNGDIQLQNSALAIAALVSLRNQGWAISDDAIQQGMAETSWPGRLQWTSWNGEKLLIDGAHNPAAAKALRQYVDSLAIPQVHWIMGMLSTKDHREIFEALLRPGDRLSLLPVSGHATALPEDLQAIAQTVCPQLYQCNTHCSLESALSSDRPTQENSQIIRVLCGSLYMLGDFLKMQGAQFYD